MFRWCFRAFGFLWFRARYGVSGEVLVLSIFWDQSVEGFDAEGLLGCRFLS